MGWGEVIGKIFNWIPKREEYRRNKIDEIQRKMAALQKGEFTADKSIKYNSLAQQLRFLQDKAKNG